MLDIESGGTAVGESILSGGSVHIGSGGVFNVSAGETLHDVFTDVGGTENILAGGTDTGNASSFNNVNGTLNVLSGGTLDHVTLNSGGTLNVQGTVASNVFVNSGAVLNVSSGGSVGGIFGSGTGLSGTENILSGGVANNIAVFSGGILNVAGETLSNITVSAGGVENVLSGGFLSGQVYSGSGNFGTSVSGVLNISAGGSAAFIGAANGGIINVAGTMLHNQAISAGGVENVLSGGVVTGVTGSGTSISGTVNVFAGGEFDHATIFTNGGVLNLSAGASAHNIVLSAGTFNVAGTTTSNVFISAGGVENVLGGGIDIGTVISTGGQEFIATGGITSNTTILSGGLATISGGGTLDLGAGATESGAVVFAGTGGKLVIDGTVMPGTVISGFAVGDTIDLTGITSGSVTSVGINASNVLQVFAGGSEFDLQLDPAAFRYGAIGLRRRWRRHRPHPHQRQQRPDQHHRQQRPDQQRAGDHLR